MTSDLAHVLVVVAALAAYVVLTTLGFDGNPVFVFVGGYAGGAALERKTPTD